MNAGLLRRVFLLFVSLGGVSLVAAPATSSSQRPPLVFLGDRDYPPLSYVEDGVAKGIDVEVAMALSPLLGRDVRVELMDWAVAQERVLRGGGDVLLPMSITPERTDVYDFAEVTGTHDFGIFIRGSNVVIRGVADLAGKRVAVTPGGLPRRLLPQTGARLDLVRDYSEGFDRLAHGAVDAVAADIGVASFTIERHNLQNIVTAGAAFATLPAAMSVRKGNAALLTEINRAVLGLRDDGTLARIKARWRPVEVLYMPRGRLIRIVTFAGAAFVGVLALAAALLTVTRRKQLRAQVERRTAETKVHLLARAIQSANDCVSIADMSDHILYVNEAFLRTYEYEEQELIGQHIEIVRAQGTSPGVSEAIAAATRQDGWRGVVRNRSKRGRVFPVALTTSTVRDEHGEVIGAVGVARDMTDEEAAAQALRTSEEKYRQVVENANDIIFTIDREGYCRSMNRAGSEISGYVSDDPRGISFTQLVVPEQSDSAAERLRRALQGVLVPRFEIDIISKSGMRRTLELDVRPVTDADGIAGVQGIARDVTARKELEAQLQQAQKMEEIGRLAGGVAHDFNNFLTVMMGCGELALVQLGSSNPVRRDIEEILRAVDSASALTRQLLIFSRRQVVHPTVLDLNEIVRQLDKMLRRLVGEHIEFIVRPGPTSGRVKADAGQLEQVVMNLVVNARDAMPSGGALTIETDVVTLGDAVAGTHTPATAGAYARLTVTDTGVGMSPEVQAQIFVPFFTTKGPVAGTGLGLATVHRIVQQSGGFITVDSAPERGATFAIYLPALDAPVERTEAPPQTAAQPFASGTILLVEDDESIRILGARGLRERGYTVLPARHAAEALRLAARHGRIDLLLTDIVMPGLNGRALAEQLQKTRPGLKVLYTSGYTTDSALMQDLHMTEAFIPKPYAPLALAQKVREVMNRPGR